MCRFLHIIVAALASTCGICIARRRAQHELALLLSGLLWIHFVEALWSTHVFLEQVRSEEVACPVQVLADVPAVPQRVLSVSMFWWLYFDCCMYDLSLYFE